LADNLSVPGHPGTVWLVEEQRLDRDYAAFGEANLDITPYLTLTGGLRYYIYDNSLVGFFGYGRNPNGPPYNPGGSTHTGVAGCYTADGSTVAQETGAPELPAYHGLGPCTDLGTYSDGGLSPKDAQGHGLLHRMNLTWKLAHDKIAYATWSTGFRPGGINRRADLTPYSPDYLTNYEIGFKTSWADRKVRWNGALFWEDWKDFQYSFLGQNGFTEIHNGPNARIKGVETDLTLVPIKGLSITTTGAFTDGKLVNNLCAYQDATYNCTAPGPNGQANSIIAPAGTRLPVAPEYKLNTVARYEFPLNDKVKAHVQGGMTYQSQATSVLRLEQPGAPIPILKGYEVFDFAGGLAWGRTTWELYAANVFDRRAEVSTYQECGVTQCPTYYMILPPRTVGIRLGYKFGP
jgi:outer membrane receptor protein involved in Fe transport